jgi:uncharacterized protein YciI
MPKFAAIFDVSDKPQGKEILKRHIDHLKALRKKGILFMCGPFKDAGKAMQILEANNYKEADLYARQDPLTVEGYFSGYALYEWTEANEENNYLQKGD